MEKNSQKQRTYILALFFMVALGHNCIGQAQGSSNLIQDGSFEAVSKNKKYPSDASFIQKGLLKFWYTPNNNSPDYFHKKAPKMNFSTPNNVQGSIAPKSGDAYVGLCTYLRYRKGYTEYISTKLTKPLNRDSLYCISIYVSKSSRADIASNSLGVLFTNDKYHIEDFPIFKKQIGIRSFKMIDSVGIWQNIILEYQATGGEEYLTIGNFSPKKTIKNIYRYKHPSSSAYVFLDDVAVYEKNSGEPCKCISFIPTVSESFVNNEANSNKIPQQQVHKDTIDVQTLTFNFVTFQSNSAELLPQAKPELDSLANLLEREQNIDIDIIGHTDNEGNKLKNALLSVERAKAVKEYLRSKGIDINRMRTRGRGDSQPIHDNKNAKGRALNRRVEIKLYWFTN